uniref:CHCH domain-containing protein n=1 Tax=Panagrolaimus sp. JU765 TaxID=591449 RepID=A0AC34QZ92_9BILA
MSGAAGPFQQRPNLVSPPLKGSFPLDHDQQCKLEMLKYMICLKEHRSRNEQCRDKAKDYFQCRMNSGLMDKDDFSKLGYKNDEKEAILGEKSKVEQLKK